MNVPTPIRLRRLKLGLTLSEVRAATGCSEADISLSERGVRTSTRLREKLEQFYSAQEKLMRAKVAR